MSNQISITRDQNNISSPKNHTGRSCPSTRNRFISEKFKKLILERRSLSKKNVVKLNEKIIDENNTPEDKLTSPIILKSNHGVVDDAPKEAIIAQSIPAISIENLIEQNMGILSQSRSRDYADELHRLIKKITLSFTAEKSESQFVVKDGIFQGSKFDIVTDDKKLSLKVSDFSILAEKVLRQNENILKYRLRRQEINLHSITFIT